jgi:hypothetical protein
MGRILAESVTRGGIKSLVTVWAGTAWYLSRIFFILKREIKPGPGHRAAAAVGVSQPLLHA